MKHSVFRFMKHSVFRFMVFLVVTFFIPQVVSAFTIEQYRGYGSSGQAGVDAAIATGTPDISAQANVIDFTDDRAFQGLSPGHSPWPLSGNYNRDDPLNTNFAAHIFGDIYIPNADFYTFATINDDGVKLSIDNSALIMDNTYHPERGFLGSTFLSAGYHSVDLRFFEGGGEATLEFLMARGQTNLPNHFNLAESATRPSPVPEPATWALMGIGILGLIGFRSKSR